MTLGDNGNGCTIGLTHAKATAQITAALPPPSTTNAPLSRHGPRKKYILTEAGRLFTGLN